MDNGPSLKERVLTWSFLLITAAVAGKTAQTWLRAWWAAVNKP